MFRISEAQQKSDARVAHAQLDMLKAIAEIGDRLELTAAEESYVVSNLLTSFLRRHLREETNE